MTNQLQDVLKTLNIAINHQSFVGGAMFEDAYELGNAWVNERSENEWVNRDHPLFKGMAKAVTAYAGLKDSKGK